MSFFTLKLSEEAKKIEIFPKFQRQIEKNIFNCKPTEVHFTIRDRVPYNKLLTNLACSSRTGEYWPSVFFVRTEHSEVRTATTSGQYSPVRPSRSVSKRLLFGLLGASVILLFIVVQRCIACQRCIVWYSQRCLALRCVLALHCVVFSALFSVALRLSVTLRCILSVVQRCVALHGVVFLALLYPPRWRGIALYSWHWQRSALVLYSQRGVALRGVVLFVLCLHHVVFLALLSSVVLFPLGHFSPITPLSAG